MAIRAEYLPHDASQDAGVAPAGDPGRSIVLSPAWKGWQRMAKRALDVAASLILLLVLAPLLLTIAVLVRLDSPGPAIFRQTRFGKDGKRFTFLKFRGMVVDAEQRQQEIARLNEADGPMFKIRKDPRVTRVGRIIRKTSLDELPQLWNVLRGEMSLVGPRPPVPAEVEQYHPWQRNRLLAKPGMTGLWQVSGRSHVGFNDMVRLDFEYIERWSIWLDLRILVSTVLVVIRGYGAY
jgi:exopolysaccharide biosynthesis polyprenyl glycosylphosphotransferase